MLRLEIASIRLNVNETRRQKLKEMKKQVRRDASRILFCTIAGVIMSVNIRTFVHTGGLLPGGFSGVTILLQNIFQRFLGLQIPYGAFYFLLNFVPALISFKYIGKKFTLYSCITILINSVATDIIPVKVITYDVLLISIFGGMINGFAISLCLKAGATSGGTDFIAIAVSEKYGIDFFNYILAFNAMVLACDGFLFGWDKALYSIIFQFTSTEVIHICYKRYKKNTLLIVTDYPEDVTNVIYKTTGHGATDVHAVGSYDNEPRTMVYSVISSEDLKKVIKEVRDVDSKAFINVMNTEALYGKFWMRPND